jgi:hypothetical protein
MIALTSAAANLTAIAAGPIVFGEPWPGDPLGQALRVVAFVLVIVAASLTPPPHAPSGIDASAPVQRLPGLGPEGREQLATEPR